MSGPIPPGPNDPGPHDLPPDHDEHALDATDGTGTYAQAYSAPESEQFVSGPYVPIDPRLYDYDNFETVDDAYDDVGPPRWPWVVGVTVIVAAIALVVSVALLFTRVEESETLATSTTPPPPTTSVPPVHDEITTTTPPTTEEPPPPEETTVETPPPTPEETTVETPTPTPEETTPEPTTTTPASTTVVPPPPARPRQITYTITGTKAPFDQITITYIDNSGQRRTQRNAYIPWSMTLTPISQSEIGSVEATSLLRLSKLNCSITASDGTVLSSNNNDAPQTSC